MPSYVDFNASKHFRDFVLTKTLTVPNGPQTFNSSNYSVHNLNTFANVDPGDVEDVREPELLKSQSSNTFKPIKYFVNENLNTFPRKANLQLYPHFVGQVHNIIGIMSNQGYDEESEMMKFAAWNINTNPQGPFFARLQQNLYSTTVGKVRLIDALNGNTATAINLVTGRDPLIESNPRITVASTLPGKAIDFLQTVAGVEFPWAEIPGDYLSNPRNPIIARQTPAGEGGKVWQDVTGYLGSLVGIQRRPTTTRKPSDLFIDYMGQRQKATLFDNLSYSKYAPDYTTTARSQNTSKIFNFIDRTAQSVKNLLGVEAPKGIAYIGDDRGEDVKDAMSIDGRPVRSSYYLSLMFDEVQARLFERTKSIIDGGGTAGKLTWISTKSKNPPHNSESIVGIVSDKGESSVSYKRAHGNSQYTDSLSTNYDFRDGSILGITQEILETMPSDGGAARSHVANVIDQTSRIFKEGDTMLSKGSAIKYVNQYTGKESGVEYCRVWTKDISYMNYSDTMKKSGNYRKFGSSVLDKSWNINIYPTSNAKGEFDASSTNMGQKDSGFFAKKYMFSIENLAWKTSNTPGFTYTDLPYCERGPNNGRIMWFPPYDLKVTENNNAKWEENFFLGRPEPIYTYNNTARSGTVNFKVIVDHPSILNLLVKKHFEGMSDAEADNYINAFFAGCQDIDFYGLVRKYTTLTPDEVKTIMDYLNGNKGSQLVTENKTILPSPVSDTPVPKNKKETPKFVADLYFENAEPLRNGGYSNLYTDYLYTTTNITYTNHRDVLIGNLATGIGKLETARSSNDTWTSEYVNDYKLLSGIETKEHEPPTLVQFNDVKDKVTSDLLSLFDEMSTNFNTYASGAEMIRTALENDTAKEVYVRVSSSASSPDDVNDNLKLSYRRSFSVLVDFLYRLHKDYSSNPEKRILETNAPIGSFDYVVKNYLKWSATESTISGFAQSSEPEVRIPFKEMGYSQEGEIIIVQTENRGEAGGVYQVLSDSANISCAEACLFLTSTELRIASPTTFRCRDTFIAAEYIPKDPEEEIKDESTQDPLQAGISPKQVVKIDGDSPTGYKLTPPIDEVKKIVMKTLSECYYFRKLEEESPTQFSSLKEKLKYFHPAFHSMTPEGLNARLTFLNQCIRPGDTLPIKGISDNSDLNARNTTFGPPPICVMRIGDFYHSKIVIRDVNIDFDENIWDLNPEGIGVQPMIANVQLNISFIGGHGLEKPVERLQNALSSNFYANTEMYDPRSTPTEDRTVFNKEFLDNLNQRVDPIGTNTNQMLTSTDKVVNGPYIGTSSNNVMNYTAAVDDVFFNTEYYTKSYVDAYNNVFTTYDSKLASMILSPVYRSIKDYNVEIGASTTAIELIGNYPTRSELETLVLNFRNVISGKTQTENITTLMGISSDMTTPVSTRSEELLKPYVTSTIVEMIEDIPANVSYLRTTESIRNKLIMSLDKLNFIIQYGYDGKIEKSVYTKANISGFTGSAFYGNYSNAISFIQGNQSKFSEDLDTSYNFYGLTMTSADLSYFLKVLLRSKKQEILSLYKAEAIFTPTIIRNIERRLNKFLSVDPEKKDFRITNYPSRISSTDILFGVSSPGETVITDNTVIQNLINVHRTRGNKTTSVLNYHRPVTGTGG